MYRSERLISYSDAIFSIALTLLVIEIRFPDDIESGLFAALLQAWPQFLSFIVSFLIITVVWFNHHEMFHHIRFVDYKLIIFNTLLMLNIVLIPFASSMLGHAFVLSEMDARLCVMLYGLWVALGGIPFNLLWMHVAKNGNLLNENTDARLVTSLKKHYRKGPILYLVAALLSLASIWIGISVYVILIVMYFLPGSLLRAGRKRASKAPKTGN